VELEGVSYADFAVPEWPECMSEGERNSFVRCSVISVSSGPHASSTNQK
jgi:hypothetical protein